ncbi:MAG: GNAT family N-acetyltransferase [Lachnospiraceae bacterium]|nr:GNAT family N-acetyltransferase [Lachnospiraceae bacterium]
MNEILSRQLALDYCCSPEDVSDNANHFTLHSFREGRRRFRESEECFLKIAVVNGKLLFTGSPAIIDWCRQKYADTISDWFFDAQTLYELETKIREYGYAVETMHPFFLPDTHPDRDHGRDHDRDPVSDPDRADHDAPVRTGRCAYGIRWYDHVSIEQFRGDPRFTEAFTFLEEAPDVLGVAAVKDPGEGGAEEILGMAGASADSPTMWQIGINIAPSARQKGIAKHLVTLLKNEIIRKGKLPYYGTSMSHIASQKVALGAGFLPAWAELATKRM